MSRDRNSGEGSARNPKAQPRRFGVNSPTSRKRHCGCRDDTCFVIISRRERQNFEALVAAGATETCSSVRDELLRGGRTDIGNVRDGMECFVFCLAIAHGPHSQVCVCVLLLSVISGL